MSIKSIPNVFIGYVLDAIEHPPFMYVSKLAACCAMLFLDHTDEELFASLCDKWATRFLHDRRKLRHLMHQHRRRLAKSQSISSIGAHKAASEPLMMNDDEEEEEEDEDSFHDWNCESGSTRDCVDKVESCGKANRTIKGHSTAGSSSSSTMSTGSSGRCKGRLRRRRITAMGDSTSGRDGTRPVCRIDITHHPVSKREVIQHFMNVLNSLAFMYFSFNWRKTDFVLQINREYAYYIRDNVLPLCIELDPLEGADEGPAETTILSPAREMHKALPFLSPTVVTREFMIKPSSSSQWGSGAGLADSHAAVGRRSLGAIASPNTPVSQNGSTNGGNGGGRSGSIGAHATVQSPRGPTSRRLQQRLRVKAESHITNVSFLNYEEFMKDNDEGRLIIFHGVYCTKSNALRKVLDAFIERNAIQPMPKVGVVNTVSEPGLTALYNISWFPTIIYTLPTSNNASKKQNDDDTTSLKNNGKKNSGSGSPSVGSSPTARRRGSQATSETEGRRGVDVSLYAAGSPVHCYMSEMNLMFSARLTPPTGADSNHNAEESLCPAAQATAAFISDSQVDASRGVATSLAGGVTSRSPQPLVDDPHSPLSHSSDMLHDDTEIVKYPNLANIDSNSAVFEHLEDLHGVYRVFPPTASATVHVLTEWIRSGGTYVASSPAAAADHNSASSNTNTNNTNNNNISAPTTSGAENALVTSAGPQYSLGTTDELKASLHAAVMLLRRIDRPPDAGIFHPVKNSSRYQTPPVFVFLGGGMAAGKTTALAALSRSDWWKEKEDEAVVVCADEFKPPNFDPRNKEGHANSTKSAELLLIQAINQYRSIVLDGTMMWAPFICDVVRVVRAAHHTIFKPGPGYQPDREEECYFEFARPRAVPFAHPYKIICLGITVEPDIAVPRGFMRQFSSGRGVLVRDQLKSFKLFSQNFDLYVTLVDKMILLNNNIFVDLHKGELPPLIAVKNEGDTALQVLDEEAYALFQKHKSINIDADSVSTMYEVKR